jgi:hypothetical protein
VTWVYGEITSPSDVSEVQVRLTPAGEGSTTLELEHTAIVPDDRWAEYGPGAVGVGWDGALLGLSLHLRGRILDDPIAWQLSDEGREFNTRSSDAWGCRERGSRCGSRCGRPSRCQHNVLLRAARARSNCLTPFRDAAKIALKSFEAYPDKAIRSPGATQKGAVAMTVTKPTIVLVHGAWADASSWTKVI